jgi:GDP-L-fucose synthase
MVRAQAAGAPAVEIWGDGQQVREFLFVDDAARGILLAAEKAKVEVLNLSGGAASTIKDVATWIKDASGFTGALTYNPQRFVGVQRRVLDGTLAEREIGWRAPTPVAAGIRATVAWYRGEVAAGRRAS